MYFIIETVILNPVLQLEVELSRQHHDGDLREKNRLARMMDNKVSGNLVFIFALGTVLARDLLLPVTFSCRDGMPSDKLIWFCCFTIDNIPGKSDELSAGRV